MGEVDLAQSMYITRTEMVQSSESAIHARFERGKQSLKRVGEGRRTDTVIVAAAVFPRAV